MEKEVFDLYQEKLKRKERLEAQIKNLHRKTGNGDKKVSEVGWLQLNYGNGSSAEIILDNKKDLIRVSNLISSMLNEELENVINEMEEL